MFHCLKTRNQGKLAGLKILRSKHSQPNLLPDFCFRGRVRRFGRLDTSHILKPQALEFFEKCAVTGADIERSV
jgi:hypothetical protein